MGKKEQKYFCNLKNVYNVPKPIEGNIKEIEGPAKWRATKMFSAKWRAKKTTRHLAARTVVVVRRWDYPALLNRTSDWSV